MEQHDLAFVELRTKALALPEPCPYCHAPTGEKCLNKSTGKPHEHVPAHYARLKLIGWPHSEVGK